MVGAELLGCVLDILLYRFCLDVFFRRSHAVNKAENVSLAAACVLTLSLKRSRTSHEFTAKEVFANKHAKLSHEKGI
jgi:hypothetical protein